MRPSDERMAGATFEAGAPRAEERMLAIARRYGWHSLRSAEEYATAIRLQRRGLGEAINGIGGHDGSFQATGRRKA